VDLVKNDDCHHATNTTAAYQATWEALIRTNRTMLHMTKASLDPSTPLSRSFAQTRHVHGFLRCRQPFFLLAVFW
jgi:hypothetical protein